MSSPAEIKFCHLSSLDTSHEQLSSSVQSVFRKCSRDDPLAFQSNMWLALECSKCCSTNDKWHTLCSAKQWYFCLHTLRLKVTLTASTPLHAPFLHLGHTCRLGETWNMGGFWFSLSSSLSLLLLGCSLLFPPSAVVCSNRQHKGRDGESRLISSCAYGELCWISVGKASSLCVQSSRLKTRELVYSPALRRGDLIRERKVLSLDVCPLQPPVPAAGRAADWNSRIQVSPARKIIWSMRSKFLLSHRLG